MSCATLRRTLAKLEARFAARATTDAARPDPAALDLVEWAATHLRHRLSTYDPTSPTLGLSQFHHDTAARLDALVTLRGQYDIDLAPRGNAKTTWRTIVYPLREALENREPYILLLSDTADTSKNLFDNLREELEGNASLLAAYPRAAGRGPVWNETRIKLRNGVVIEAASTGTALRGAVRRTRPTLIVFDDLQNIKVIVSPTLRQRAWDWFTRTVLPLGEPRTNFVGSDTAIHRDAVGYRLATRTPGWNARVYKALISPPARTDLWDQWERVLHRQVPTATAEARAFYEANKAAMDEGTEVLWPERFPLYTLMSMLVTMGRAAFASEENNNPTNPDLNEWPEEYFDDQARPEFWFDEWPSGLVIRAMALDPSKGTRDKPGDYSALVLFGATADGTEYVEADLFRGNVDATTDAIIRRSVHHVREFRPDVFGYEAVLFQSLYGRLLQEALAAARLEVHLVPSADPTDKDVRIRRLTTPLAKRRLRFRRNKGTMLLVDQLRDFGPAATHRDGPDALELVRRTAWKWWKRRGEDRGVQGYTT